MFLLLSIKVTEGKSCSFGLLLVSLVNVMNFVRVLLSLLHL